MGQEHSKVISQILAASLEYYHVKSPIRASYLRDSFSPAAKPSAEALDYYRMSLRDNELCRPNPL
jgi:hypothetical protein